jgi:DNA-binding CsgD family transcriptional regulator
MRAAGACADRMTRKGPATGGGGGADDPSFRHLFSTLFIPDGTPAQMDWYDELLRRTTSPEAAVRLFRARGGVDVTGTAGAVQARTLVMHSQGDRVVPVEEGRLLASLIPGARLVILDSANHILLADEPAWEQYVSELEEFLGTAGAPPARAALGELSARELEVLELVAAGLTNEAIAERLFLSVRTIEHHLSNVYAKLGLSGKAARAAAAVSFVELQASARQSTR